MDLPSPPLLSLPSSSSSQPFLLSSSPSFKPSLTSPLKQPSLRLYRSPHPPPVRAAAHSGQDLGSSDASASLSPELSNIDRRQLLLGSTSLSITGLPSLLLPHGAHSSPVQPPDLKSCTTPIDPGNGAPSVDCCLPVSTTITDFKLPTNLPVRTRISAHQASAAYIAKYKLAYKRLRELPASDPRQYSQQANVHCAFCDAAYDVNGTEIEYQVHFSWLFFPWHRWYLYFHERILASLINDDTFALPFWNWDAASGYTIPPLYADSQSSLYDSNRNPVHNPPTVVDLNYNFTESNLSPAAQLAANNSLMYTQMVTGAKTPSLFFGQAYRQGDAASPGMGTIENVPHGPVHAWTGNPANPNDENMGALYSASRDPIFYGHHANIDRLWVVWKTLGGRRTDINDPDYLNATFLFYDENAQLVRVRIGDALDPSKLAYKYQDVPNAWLSTTATSSSSATAMNFGPAGGPAPAMAGPVREKIKEKLKNFKADLKEFKDRASRKIESAASVLVKRPKKVRADDYEEEILVLEGVAIAADDKIKFDVFINLIDGKDDGKVGCDVPEYAGSFFNVPHMGMKMGEKKKIIKSNFRLGIGEVLKQLDAEDDDDFAITIVPRGKPSVPLSIASVRLEYE